MSAPFNPVGAAPPLTRVALRAAVLLLLLASLLWLAGCGGGDAFPDEEDLKQINPPDCKAEPERCR